MSDTGSEDDIAKISKLTRDTNGSISLVMHDVDARDVTQALMSVSDADCTCLEQDSLCPCTDPTASNYTPSPPPWYSKQACHSFMESLQRIDIETPIFNRDHLGPDQKFAFDAIVSRLLDRSSSAVRAIISGCVGTGKSALVHALWSELRGKCRVCSVTGVAAPIYGDTIHSLFLIPPYNSFRDITDENLARLRRKLQEVTCILFDGYSMYVAAKLLSITLLILLL
jgi:hypothetical protein